MSQARAKQFWSWETVLEERYTPQGKEPWPWGLRGNIAQMFPASYGTSRLDWKRFRDWSMAQ